MSDECSIRVSNGLLTDIHPPAHCKDNPGGCWIHTPRPHRLADAPVHWREDKHTAERLCEHGLGHPDPQDAAYWWTQHHRDVTIHGCDACCTPLPDWARTVLPDTQRLIGLSTVPPRLRALPAFKELLVLGGRYNYNATAIAQWLNGPTTYLDDGDGAKRPIDLIETEPEKVLDVAQRDWGVVW